MIPAYLLHVRVILIYDSINLDAKDEAIIFKERPSITFQHKEEYPQCVG